MARYTETIFPIKKVVNLTAEQAERIREYRFSERLESENEAIRRLIEAGLKTSAESSPVSPGSSGSGSKRPRSQGKGLPATTLGRDDSAPNKPTPRPRKPAAPTRKAESATPLSKEAQIRALREQGAR